MSERPKILCVDDEPDNVDALERLFRKKYQVFKAVSGAEAIALIDQHEFAVVISDQRMPKMTGVELLGHVFEHQPESVRILLTGYTDIDAVVAAINTGHVYRYVTKPWDSVDLSNAVDKAVERYQLGRLVLEQNAQLAKALKELRSLDEAKSRFMILVNHELKTPLTAILSFGDLLGESGLNSEQSIFLSRIKSSTLRLEALVNDVLQIMLASTQQLKIQLGLFDISLLKNFASDGVLNQAAKREIRFDFDLQPAQIRSDERLIRDVLSRLLLNAARFAEPGSTARVLGRRSQGKYQISVMTDGPEVSEDRIRSLDQPFQVAGSIMNHAGGTGLGWSVCQAVLSSLDSRLEISSRPTQNGLATLSVSFSLPV
jgi:signal transduction histidine kinase